MPRNFIPGAKFVFAVALVATLAGAAGAQEPQAAFPVTPDPAECAVAPRPVEDLLAAFDEAAGSVPADAETPDEAVIPLGYPAGAERADEVAATLREVVACFNAGDFARATALFTDDGLRRFFAPWEVEETLSDEEIAQLTTPVETDSGFWQTLLAVAEVQRQTDGRLTAFVVIGDPAETTGQPTALFLYFARVDGRWLIDDFVEMSKV